MTDTTSEHNEPAHPAGLGCNEGLGAGAEAAKRFRDGAAWLMHGTPCKRGPGAADFLLAAQSLEGDERAAKILGTTPGQMTSAQLRAFREFDASLVAAVESVRAAGVPQGLIVALLHGQAHQQTAAMMGGA